MAKRFPTPAGTIDCDGNIFRYVVAAHEQLERTDVQKMLADSWDLTLFTCTYGGANRVTVRLTRVTVRLTRVTVRLTRVDAFVVN